MFSHWAKLQVRTIVVVQNLKTPFQIRVWARECSDTVCSVHGCIKSLTHRSCREVHTRCVHKPMRGTTNSEIETTEAHEAHQNALKPTEAPREISIPCVISHFGSVSKLGCDKRGGVFLCGRAWSTALSTRSTVCLCKCFFVVGPTSQSRRVEIETMFGKASKTKYGHRTNTPRSHAWHDVR